MSKKRVLLAVLAHPDDESFGTGGTLALYASRGTDVYLVCATGGEVGTVDPEHLAGHSSIAELRDGELRCAAEHLGLKDVFLLGYRDSGMPGTEPNHHPDAQINHPLDEVAGKVVRYIRELKADVVLTFDPIGGYRHPDHIHIQQATVLAFERANDPAFHPEAGAPYQPARLYFNTFPRGLLKLGVRLIRLTGGDPTKFGRNKDVDLASLADVSFPTHASIDYGEVAGKKAEASACHASQGGMQMRRGFLGVLVRLLGHSESYMRAYPPANGREKVVHDLFEGLAPG